MTRIAFVSDMHGNLVALEAVLADLETTRPDQVVVGGDIALGGPRPVEVVDRLRALGWPAVKGNSDAAVAGDWPRPDMAGTFIGQAAARTAEMLGPERVEWLASLPLAWRDDAIAAVHAVPGDPWPVVMHDDPDERLRDVYSPLGVATAVYGHIHHPYVRRLPGLTVLNSGSVSLSLDRDIRASYVIVDGDQVEHRRIPYDVEAVAREMVDLDYPNHARYVEWLRTGWTP